MNQEQANQNQAYRIGYNNGRDAVVYNRHEVDSLDELFDEAFEAEMNSRQFSPFELTAKIFNNSQNPESLWEAYERGVGDAIQREIEALAVGEQTEPYIF